MKLDLNSEITFICVYLRPSAVDIEMIPPPLESLTHCPDMLLWLGVGVTIQLTLPPTTKRAAWWQPALLLHVAWIRRVRNEIQGADYECDSCCPFGSLMQGACLKLFSPLLIRTRMARIIRIFTDLFFLNPCASVPSV